MKLKEFLKVCVDTDIVIKVSDGRELQGTEYRHIHDLLDSEIQWISILYDHITVMISYKPAQNIVYRVDSKNKY